MGLNEKEPLLGTWEAESKTESGQTGHKERGRKGGPEETSSGQRVGRKAQLGGRHGRGSGQAALPEL